MQTGDPFGFVVEDRDPLLAIGGDNTTDKVIQENIIIEFSILKLGIESGVLDGRRKLIPDNL